MPPTTKVELYAAIRRDDRAGLSSRAIQRKHGVGRRTVVKALASVWPEPRKPLDEPGNTLTLTAGDWLQVRVRNASPEVLIAEVRLGCQ